MYGTHRNRISKSAVVWSVVGVTVIILGFTWSKTMFGQAPSELKKELDSATRDGMPIEPADLRNRTAVPVTQNAGPKLTEAFDLMKGWQASKEGKSFSKDAKVISLYTPLKNGELDRLRPAVASAHKVLATIEDAVKYPLVDFKRQWELGPGLMLPEYAYSRSACSLLIARSRIFLADGNIKDALASLDTASKLANLIGKEPVTIAALVKVSIQSMVLREVGDFVRTHSKDLGSLEVCRKVVLDLGAVPSVRDAIGAELMSGRIAVKMLGRRDGEKIFGEGQNKVLFAARFGPARSLFELRFVQIMHRLFMDLGKKPGSFIEMHRAFQRVDQKLSGQTDWTYGLAELMSPSFSGVSVSMGESEARKNLLLTAIDLFESHASSGVFPSLGTGVPFYKSYQMDPFTEKPLTYKPLPGGFLLYSYGPDGKDDNGKRKAKEKVVQDYDLVFRFPPEPFEQSKKFVQ